MFIGTWNKYLPVIKILLKRSENDEQKLDMNQSDFQRAAGGKKAKFTFSFTLVNGRPQNPDDCPPLAKDLITALQANDITNRFITGKTIVFAMNNDFQLLIKNDSPARFRSEEDLPANEEVIPKSSHDASEN
jgi:hypothetical protein